MNRKWLLSYRNNDISYRDAREFGGYSPRENFKMIDAIWCVLMHYFDRLSLKSTTICYKKYLLYITPGYTPAMCYFASWEILKNML